MTAGTSVGSERRSAVARRLIGFAAAIGFVLGGTAPAQAQPLPGVGGFACQFHAYVWPGEGYASCGAGTLPGGGSAWGTWAVPGGFYYCAPTCAVEAEFVHFPGICPPGLPPALTTGTGTVRVVGAFFNAYVDFDWVVAGTVLVIVPQAGASTTGAGVGSFVPMPPLTTCVNPMDQTAHVTATLVTTRI
jgi:hypothetical protein